MINCKWLIINGRLVPLLILLSGTNQKSETSGRWQSSLGCIEHKLHSIKFTSLRRFLSRAWRLEFDCLLQIVLHLRCRYSFANKGQLTFDLLLMFYKKRDVVRNIPSIDFNYPVFNTHAVRFYKLWCNYAERFLFYLLQISAH